MVVAVAQILLTFALVYVTWRYARETTKIAKSSEEAAKSAALQAEASIKMAKEMSESTSASLRPIIVMGRSPAYGVIENARQVGEQSTIRDRTWLYNTGPGPALNINFLLQEPNRKNPSGTFTGKKLIALGPGEAYELMIANTFGQQRLSTHDLIVEYEDVFGNKWRSGLELNHTSAAGQLTVLRAFHEKINQ